MTKKKWFVPSGIICLALVLLVACTPAVTPTPTAKPTPSPTSKPTTAPSPTLSPVSKPAPTPSPTSSPTAKPTTTPASVSFAGKTITIVVPYGVGGGMDMAARLYAKCLPDYLPGKPNMVVRNMPGGASSIGMNYTYASKPDGLTLTIGGGSIPMNQLLGSKAVNYDLLKMPAIIAVSGKASVFYAGRGIVGKPEDIAKAKGIIFGFNASSNAYTFILAKELLNFSTEKIILGYTSAAEALRAFLSGEINCSAGSASVYMQTLIPLVEKGEITLLFQTGIPDGKGNLVRDSNFPPQVPTLGQLYETLNGKPPSGIAWNANQVMAGIEANDRLLWLPPGTSDSIVRAYWDAAGKMVKDAGFLKLSDALYGADVGWVVGEPLNSGFKLSFGITPEAREWLRSTLQRYGVVID